MAEKIDIVEILKDKPQGTKLYSSACGKCKLEEVDDKSFKISFYNSKFGFMNGGEGYLDKNGKLYDDGECVVFPSKEMRDWRKFAWKKGDVLVSKDRNVHIIFEKFEDDAYTKFRGKHYLWEEGGSMVSFEENEYYMQTSDFNKANKEEAQTYINTIEEKLGGKLNRETLVVEKTQPEFKDGDILCTEDFLHGYIYIYKEPSRGIDICYCYKITAGYLYICNLENRYDCVLPSNTIKENKTRFATDSEKQQLFDALAEEGKRWDSEKKQIVDLPKKCELNPFDRVLVRDNSKQKWIPDMYRFYDKDEEFPYNCFSSTYKRCIPYNEETAHLLGTTDEWKGGEG